MEDVAGSIRNELQEFEDFNHLLLHFLCSLLLEIPDGAMILLDNYLAETIWFLKIKHISSQFLG